MSYEPIKIRMDPVRDGILDGINSANSRLREVRDGISAYMQEHNLTLVQVMEMDEKPEELVEFLEDEFACDRVRKRYTKELLVLGE
jgi:hypothetical protein